MLNIDQLRNYYDRPFLDLKENLNEIKLDRYPNYIYWYLRLYLHDVDQICFQLNTKSNELYYDIIFVARLINTHYKIYYINETETNNFLKKLFKRYFYLDVIPELRNLGLIQEL